MPTPPLILPDAPLGASAPRERASPPDAHGRWLRELERAHATLRARAVSGANANAPAQDAPPGRRAVPGRETARAEASLAQATEKDVRSPRRAPTAGASDASAAQGASPRKAQTAPGDPFAPTHVTRAREAQSRASATPRESAPAPRGAPWPKTNAHAFARAQGATVWIRDATLDPASHAGLLQDLRARLRAAGWSMASLFVNGRRVDEVGAEQPNPEHLNGGNDAN